MDKILDQAISRTKNGENISAVVSSYPQKYQAPLTELLGIVSMASKLPKRQVPEPMRRKLFLDAEVNFAWYKKFLVIVRYSIPVAMALLILTITGTVHIALGSLPGDALFPVKKAVETTEIKFSQNPETRAKLQLDLASQRLEEAKTVIAKTEDPQVKEKALKELNEQTETALNNLKAVASTPAISHNPDIVAKAEQLTKDQKSLATQIDPERAKKISLAHTQTISDIKGIIATTTEQTSATLAANDQIIISSNIDAIKNNTIKIDKNVFTVDTKNTEIKDKEGNTVDFDSLQVNDTIKIEGKISDKTNIAEKVTLLAKAPKEEEKEPTDKTPEKVEKPKVPKTTNGNTGIVPPKEEANPVTTTPVEKPQDTYGGFIPESPASTENTL